MQVDIMPQAWSDLAEIGDYIAEDNEERARSFVDELHEASMSLAAYPERYALVPEYRDLGVRSRSHGAYVIFYRIKHERVQVLRVVHGRRDLINLDFG
jgi:toxin ParE1/3/4